MTQLSTNDGTRDAERVYLAGEVTGEVSVYEPMSILDLSERGALVETRFPLHLDSLHDFRLVLQAVPVIIKGRIVHSQVRRARAGSRRLPHRPGIHRAFGTRTAGDPLVRRAPEAGRTRRASNRRR